jgi:hypothetical protein
MCRKAWEFESPLPHHASIRDFLAIAAEGYLNKPLPGSTGRMRIQ